MTTNNLLDFHFTGHDPLVRPRFPYHVSRHAVNLSQSVQRHKRRILHEHPTGLLQDRYTLFLIAGLLFFVDELVEFRAFVLDARANAGAKILVIDSIRVGCRPADVIEWSCRLSARRPARRIPG